MERYMFEGLIRCYTSPVFTYIICIRMDARHAQQQPTLDVAGGLARRYWSAPSLVTPHGRTVCACDCVLVTGVVLATVQHDSRK